MTKQQKRKVDIIVLSDIHLGTFGCSAVELLNYLKTVNPKTLILNGDIIDIWQFNKHYFPKAHMKVIKYITTLLSKGVKVYYITGNHDEMLRKFEGFKLGEFEITNKLLLNLDGKKAWFFHGDVFDISMKHSKWLAKLGGIGYDYLILMNTLINFISQKLLRRGRISLAKKIKNGVKGALNHINNFEKTVADIAIYNAYDYVVCGHIHQVQKRIIKNKDNKEVMYLNSGDWIENLTSLEYNNQEWSIYYYHKDSVAQSVNPQDTSKEEGLYKMNYKNKQLFNELLDEFKLSN